MPDYLLITGASLAALPTSGTPWNALVTASNADPGTGNLGALDQTHPQKVLNIALRYARDGGGLGKTYVENEIKAVMGTEGSASQPLNPYRTWGVYFLAADLVGMSPTSGTGANGQTMVQWGQAAIHKVIPGQSNWNTLWKCSRTSGNNWGACARVSAIIICLYLKKHGITSLTGVPSGAPTTVQGTLDALIGYYKRFLGDTNIPNTFIATSAYDSRWALSSYPSNQGVINADSSDKTRAGANVEDASRTAGGPPLTGGSGIHYQYECIDGMLMLIPVLVTAGYTDAAGWANSACKRNIGFMRDNKNSSGVQLWLPGEPEFHKWMWIQPWVANHLYPGLSWPIPSGATDRNARRLLTAHGDWLATSGSTWGKSASDGDGGGGGGTAVTPPNLQFSLAANSNQGVTMDASSTTAGSAPLSTFLIEWGDGTSDTIFEPSRVKTHTYSITVATSFIVKVTATATDGGTANLSGSTGPIYPADGSPSATFTVKTADGRASGEGPLTVYYSFEGSSDPNSDPLTYHVDWGDGTSGTVPDVEGTYTYAAVTDDTGYTVRAWVVAGSLTSNIVIASITVLAPPAPDASIAAYSYVAIGGRRTRVLPPYQASWDGAHPILDTYHLWFDTAGRLRTKSSAPTSATDGSEVGATNAMVVVNAGADAATARPAGAPAVWWKANNGVTPTNAVQGDAIVRPDGTFVVVTTGTAPPPATDYDLKSGLEIGPDEAQISAAHTGNPSAWDIATENTAAGGVLRYDNARAHAGTYSARIATGATSTSAFLGWNLATSTPKVGIWLYLTANPGVLFYPIQFLLSGTAGRVGINTTGKVVVTKDSDPAILATSTASVPLNEWFLLSADFTYHASTGTASAYVYTGTSSTPVAQAVATNQAFATASVSQVRLGIPISAANIGPIWLDDAAADTTSRIVP